MKVIELDLFSGIGGFSKGLEEAGFDIVKHFFSEIDKHAIANYKHNFKNSEYVGSVTDVRRIIRTINEAREGHKLVITFGSPCQDFSLAGKRRGLEGQRSSLIRFALFLIKWLRPDFYIWENVKGAYSSNDGADYWAIIQAFANIDGYRREQQLFNTSWFLPQNRERIYLVGHLAGRSEPGIFPIRENNTRFTERATEATVNCLTAGGPSGWMHSSVTLIQTLQGGDTINTIRSGGRGSLTKKHSWDIIQVNTSTESGGKQPYQQNRIYDAEGISPALDQAAGRWAVKELTNKFRFHKDDKRKSGIQGADIFKEDCSLMDIIDNHPKNIIQGEGIRRLTEIECERLQGFPDNWTKYGNYDGQVKEISKTQRYKMCGNAVSVPVVKAIGQRILSTLFKQSA